MAAHSSILAWETARTDGPGGLLSIRVTKSRSRLSHEHLHFRSRCSVILFE